VKANDAMVWDHEGRLERLGRQAVAIPGRVARTPGLLPDVWHKATARFVDRRHRQRVGEYGERVVTPGAALATLFRLEEHSVDEALRAASSGQLIARLEAYRPPSHTLAMGGPAYLELAYALVRLMHPPVVVETGVAHGYSSAAILAGLDDAGRGRLYSIDLPAFRQGVRRHTGGAVGAAGLAERAWTLILGSDRSVLPSLLLRLGPVPLFFYDSDKGYEAMSRSLDVMWDSLAPGGVIVVDDVEVHDAFLDFVDRIRGRSAIVSKPVRPPLYQRPGLVGLVRKEAAE
jgi:predicted O-methyltransferase YrrM